MSSEKSTVDRTFEMIDKLDVERDQYFEQMMGDQMALLLLTRDLILYQDLITLLWKVLSKRQKGLARKYLADITKTLPDVNKFEGSSLPLTHFRKHVSTDMCLMTPEIECYYCKTRLSDEKKDVNKWGYFHNPIMFADRTISRFSENSLLRP